MGQKWKALQPQCKEDKTDNIKHTAPIFTDFMLNRHRVLGLFSRRVSKTLERITKSKIYSKI